MAIYVVMEPPGAAGSEAETRAVLVRDAFSAIAFLLPPLWLLWHRLWIEAALALAGEPGADRAWRDGRLRLHRRSPVAAGFDLCRAGGRGPAGRRLRRRGWRQWGVVEAASRDEAEIRYLAGAAPEQPAREQSSRHSSRSSGGPSPPVRRSACSAIPERP